MIGDTDLRKAMQDPPASDLEYIRSLRAAALVHVERITGHWYGEPRDRTVTLTGSGARSLSLWGPIVAGYEDAVTVSERAYPGAVPLVIAEGDASGWEILDGRLLRRGGGGWWSGYLYEVTYRQGVAGEEEIPADIGLWIQQLVTGWYEVRAPVSEALQKVPTGAEAIMQSRRWMPI